MVQEGDAPGMLEAHEVVVEGDPRDRLALTWEARRRSRLRAVTAAGTEIGLFLPRGTVLLHGDLLRADDGTIIEVVAAVEDVSTVTPDDPATLARVAYHLGNRHIRTQIGPDFLRYRHDRVIDDLVRSLGVEVEADEAPFEPERGTKDHVHDHDAAG